MGNLKVCTKCGQEKPATIEYFVGGKDCKDGLRGECRECYSAIRKKYREGNKEHIALVKKQIYERNKERILKHNKEYREKNIEAIHQQKKEYRKSTRLHNMEKSRTYYYEHKEELSIKGKAYREANKEKLAKRSREYIKNHRESLNITKHNWRAKRRSLPHTLTTKQWEKIKEHFDYKCAYCGEEKPLAQEHFYPMSLGGEYTVSNIICACKRCNGSKGARDFFEWYPKQSFYSKQREKKILSYLKYKDHTQQLAFIL